MGGPRIPPLGVEESGGGHGLTQGTRPVRAGTQPEGPDQERRPDPSAPARLKSGGPPVGMSRLVVE
ncbi:MAG TPA: hypothetical protein VKA68_17725 [bacterium]|nr:hypothetical protein [bacterium]